MVTPEARSGPRPPVHLLLSYDFPPLGGGVSRWMAELARRYPPGGLVVSTGSLPGAAEVDDALPNRVDRLPLPAGRLRTLQGLVLWSRRVTTLARELSAEFAWCGNLRPAAYPARWARSRAGLPYGILLHGHDLLSTRHRVHRSRIKRSTVRSLLGSAAVLVANSRWTGDLCRTLLDDLGLPSGGDRVTVVPLGTDPLHFRPDVDPALVRARYGLPAGRYLLTVARLTGHKGIDTVLRVVARLTPAHPDLRYAVVGHGDREAALRALAAELGLAERVHFLTGVPDADLPALYNLADVYVGVSRHAALMVEGFGISLVEASACGKPVVAGLSGGMPDAVRDGETGLLVEPEDEAAVAGAVARLLSDAALAATLGRQGRRAAETFYNWDRVTADLRALAAAHARAVAPSVED